MSESNESMQEIFVCSALTGLLANPANDHLSHDQVIQKALDIGIAIADKFLVIQTND